MPRMLRLACVSWYPKVISSRVYVLALNSSRSSAVFAMTLAEIGAVISVHRTVLWACVQRRGTAQVGSVP